MEKTLEVIAQQIALVEMVLKDMREEFDKADAKYPYAVARIAQDIAIAAAKLDALNHLFKILGGVK